MVKYCTHSDQSVQTYNKLSLVMGLAWRSGCVMNCHATALGSIPGGDGIKTQLHVLRKGQ